MRQHEAPTASGLGTVAAVAAALLVLFGAARCGKAPAPANFGAPTAELRIGVGQIASAASTAGMRQVVNNLSVEEFAHLTEHGRTNPWVAAGWDMAADHMSLRIQLRPNVKFHDGTPLTSAIVAQILKTSMPGSMGPAFADVASISAADEKSVEIKLSAPSSFVLESLEASVQKPGGGIGTGPFLPSAPGPAIEMRANADYYLGRPPIDRIVVNAYPSVRTAWAEMLRGRLDMLYEVGIDAVGSMQGASNVAIYAFPRPYQYLVILNPHVEALRSADIRKALNAAVDRESLIREALDGHGSPSYGPVSARHWAFSHDLARLGFDPMFAKTAVERSAPRTKVSSQAGLMRLKCLVPADSLYERVALVLKRQLEAVGVEMDVQEDSQDKVFAAASSGQFDAVLVDAVSGPSVFRSYQWWHSGTRFNFGKFESAAVDSALDSIRHATSDEAYRAGVAAYQQAIVNDPPAIFLAWSERVRAVSKRFDVPAEPGVDILGSIRLWRPVSDSQVATRNDN